MENWTINVRVEVARSAGFNIGNSENKYGHRKKYGNIPGEKHSEANISHDEMVIYPRARCPSLDCKQCTVSWQNVDKERGWKMDRESRNGGIAFRKYSNWKGALVGGRKLNLSEFLFVCCVSWGMSWLIVEVMEFGKLWWSWKGFFGTLDTKRKSLPKEKKLFFAPFSNSL